MKLLVVGGGGREHVIISKLRENKQVEQIYALPGNGGIASLAECVPIEATDIEGIRAFAQEKRIDFAVIAPDNPLVLGAVDVLEQAGIPCFGPSRAAAAIEGSKVFAKELMRKYNIPTAEYQSFSDPQDALAYCRQATNYPLVIKADGLAYGKGVLIADNAEDACRDVYSIMEERIFGASGNSIIIEEFLTGPEVTVLAFTDGKAVAPMVSSMDHKRALDGDRGLNTGGMGVIAPNPFYTPELAAECMEKIYLPTIRAMQAEGCPFKGCLYFGLMLTERGPRVIEYNCRFGDPEAQAVLSLLQSDLLDIMLAVAEERLDQAEVKFSNDSACCVMLASKGYPQRYEAGYEIKLGDTGSARLYHSGTRLEQGGLFTAGGRVLGVTSVAPTLKQAVSEAYQAVKQVYFTDMYYRTDIGKKALQRD